MYFKGEESGSDASASDSESTAEELGVARLIGSLEHKRPGVLSVETRSVYGAVILMPQLARSAGWPKLLTSLAIQSFVFGALNFVFQFWLLSVVSKEEAIYAAFGGEMYLCDFAEGRRGPLGTRVENAGRLYANFAQWNTRVFVRDSLMAIFPDRAQEIHDSVDPGEYGAESYRCRYLCGAIFVMSTLPELFLIGDLARMLYAVPTAPQSWLDSAARGRQPGGDTWGACAEAKVAGMPRSWKLINLLFVFLPKAILWKITVQAGITFLMNTAAIDDLIINAVALTFILNIDEMIFEVFIDDDTKDVLKSCEGFPLYREAETVTDEQLLDDLHNMSHSGWSFHDLSMLVPWRLVLAIAVSIVAIGEYYWSHCRRGEDGFVSQTMYLPTSSEFTVLNTVLPNFFKLQREPEPFWTMPPEK